MSEKWTITNVKPFERNTCRAFFDVVLPPGLTLRGFTLHEKDGKRWASFPTTTKLDEDGIARRDPQTGKIRYYPVVFIEDRALWQRFSTWAAEEAYKQLPRESAPVAAPRPAATVEDDIPW